MPRRIQRQRIAGWKMPANTVYVGRPTKWGNPFTVEPETCCPTCGQLTSTGTTPAQAVEAYRYFMAHPQNLKGHAMPSLDSVRTELRGKDLACWCPLDQPCHADVLLELANEDEPKA